MKFIIIIVIVLVIIVAAQLMKVYELSSRLRDKDEADVTPTETKFNAGMLLMFYLAMMISSTYLFIVYGARPGLGPSASEYGQDIDFLYDANWVIILIVFYLTQTLLFGFAIKYQQKKGRKAVFFAHSNRLELVWTIIPAVVLTGIIIGGLSVWNKITTPKDNPTIIELYAKQFDWTVRYSGMDNKLGNSDFKVIETDNPLGVVTTDLVDLKNASWSKEAIELSMEVGMMDLESTVKRVDVHKDTTGHKSLHTTYVPVLDSLKIIYEGYSSGKHDIFEGQSFDQYVAGLKAMIEAEDYQYYDAVKLNGMKDKAARLQRQVTRLAPLRRAQTAETDKNAEDDLVIKELVLIKGVDYEFRFRSRDVIHSALFPEFRAQMNCVPGMVTKFSFTPILTTEEMRKNPVIEKKYKKLNKKRAAAGKEEVEFNFLLLCNKICGASHYNMQLNIVVVEDQKAFDEWYKGKSAGETFGEKMGTVEVTEKKEESVEASNADSTNTDTIAVAVNLIP